MARLGTHDTTSSFVTIIIRLLRTFVDAWHGMMKTHESIADNRIRFSQRLNEMSEELVNLQREVEKNRKQVRQRVASGSTYTDQKTTVRQKILQPAMKEPYKSQRRQRRRAKHGLT